jgi:hypothetical protein
MTRITKSNEIIPIIASATRDPLDVVNFESDTTRTGSAAVHACESVAIENLISKTNGATGLAGTFDQTCQSIGARGKLRFVDVAPDLPSFLVQFSDPSLPGLNLGDIAELILVRNHRRNLLEVRE